MSLNYWLFRSHAFRSGDVSARSLYALNELPYSFFWYSMLRTSIGTLCFQYSSNC